MEKLTGVGSRLAALRSRAGLTQRETADAASINIRTYQTYEFETREISARALACLEAALNWNPRWILSGKGEPLIVPAVDTALDLLRRLEAHLEEQKVSLATDKKVRIFGILLRDSLQGSAASDQQLIELVELSK
jgi:transcriptional regulator with XRE-family HTH domain